MKKTLLALSLFMAAWTVQAADLLYGLYQGSGTPTARGTKKAETYDVAIHLADPFLVGKEVRGLRIPINTAAQNVTGYKAWLSSALTLDSDKKNVPDIRCVSFTPSGSWTDVTFDEPYIITEEGLYVGYSFEVSSVNTTTSDANQTPLMCFDGDDGLYIHTSRTYRKWMTTTSLGTSALLLRLGGEGIHQRAVKIPVTRMHHHPGWLVHHQYILVFIDDIQRNVLRDDIHAAAAIRHHEPDHIAGADDDIRLGEFPVHEDITGLDGALDAVTGRILQVG